MSPIFISSLLISTAASASDKPKLKMTLSDKLSEDQKTYHKTENEQLEKARKAAAETAKRELDVLSHQQNGEWEQEQRDKAQAQFNERKSREQKYLQEAQQAAKKERKIIKKMSPETKD
ncbi:hypothetical protein G3R49_17210 [Shewanella sp. WXL01]|uniref:Uncharacterized protein n=1 Tax=Shewanella maritima TaxID=2520507 RepID=A0A411PN14_9GAMM|nr:hypothetical protein [Shewanella sp. WXL01]QBF84886.1 hypothetical protein EXU30_11690 [Shewanella maritima]